MTRPKPSLGQGATPRRASDMIRMYRFLREEKGATAVEYAVMLALILMTLIVAVRTVGSSTSGIWANNNERLNEAGF